MVLLHALLLWAISSGLARKVVRMTENTVEGDLVAKDVLIGASGVVTGTTEADFIDVKGELNESITSKNVLIVRNTGKVTGDVTYGEIEIERGGKIKGGMKQV